MPIHNVDVDHAAAARRSPLHLIRQVGKVGREYRGCKFDQARVQAVVSKAVEILARCGEGHLCWCGDGAEPALSGAEGPRPSSR
jgi:hypothetical protein